MTGAGPPPFLPYARQRVDDVDIAAVEQVLRGDWLTTGPAVDRFEALVAEKTGARFAVSCSSGTAALHLACLALGLGPGDAVIVPSITFLATANAVRMVGAEPIFADVNPDNGLLTPDGAASAIARATASDLRVRAVFPVHLAGQCADLAALAAVAGDAVLVEDACHAIGTLDSAPGSSAPVGACRLSKMAVFSFHAVKTIAAGEGGAVTTNDPELHARLTRLRNHGMTREAASFQTADLAFDESGAPNPWYYEMPEIGWNYRLSDIHAALAASQLARLDRLVAERRTLVQRYDDLLTAGGRLAAPIRRVKTSLPAWHLYPVLIDFVRLGISRAALMRELRAAGIGTQVHYIPVHRQPYYAARDPGLTLPGAETYYRRTLSLPLYVGMTLLDVERVAGALQSILLRHQARAAS